MTNKKPYEAAVPHEEKVRDRLHEDALMQLLLDTAHMRRESLKSLAKSLGISYERLCQLRAKTHPFAHTRREVLQRISAYLELPMVLVLTHAGQVKLEDFSWPTGDPLQGRIRAVLAAMRSDPLVGAFAPADLDSASPAVQLFVVFLYEHMTREPRTAWRFTAWMGQFERAVGQVERRSLYEATGHSETLFS